MEDYYDIYAGSCLEEDFDDDEEFEGLCPRCQYPIRDGICTNCGIDN